jgi:hypothetical protein
MLDLVTLQEKYGLGVADKFHTLWTSLEEKFPDQFSAIARLTSEDLLITSVSVEHIKPIPAYTGPRKVYTKDLHTVPPPPPGTLLTVVLDLDQTLIFGKELAKITPSSTLRIEIFLRPFVRELIRLLTNIPSIRVIVWSAGSRRHVLTSLNLIDPENKIDIVICRNDYATVPNWSPEHSPPALRAIFDDLKILEWLPECNGDVVLFDDFKKLFMPVDTDPTHGTCNIINILAFTDPEDKKETIDFTLILILIFILNLIDQKRQKAISTHALLTELVRNSTLSESFTGDEAALNKGYVFGEDYKNLFTDIINNIIHSSARATVIASSPMLLIPSIKSPDSPDSSTSTDSCASVAEAEVLPAVLSKPLRPLWHGQTKLKDTIDKPDQPRRSRSSRCCCC